MRPARKPDVGITARDNAAKVRVDLIVGKVRGVLARRNAKEKSREAEAETVRCYSYPVHDMATLQEHY